MSSDTKVVPESTDPGTTTFYYEHANGKEMRNRAKESLLDPNFLYAFLSVVSGTNPSHEAVVTVPTHVADELCQGVQVFQDVQTSYPKHHYNLVEVRCTWDGETQTFQFRGIPSGGEFAK